MDLGECVDTQFANKITIQCIFVIPWLDMLDMFLGVKGFSRILISQLFHLDISITATFPGFNNCDSSLDIRKILLSFLHLNKSLIDWPAKVRGNFSHIPASKHEILLSLNCFPLSFSTTLFASHSLNKCKTSILLITWSTNENIKYGAYLTKQNSMADDVISREILFTKGVHHPLI